MNKRNERSRMAAMLVAGCLALAAGTVAAQPAAALPAVQQQGQVQYLMGGFGHDESEAIKAASSSYPLALTFAATQGGAYLADVQVAITDAQGKAVLSTTADGPYLLVKLPPGNYKISARFKDKEQTRQVTVSGQGTVRQTFNWDA
ncbi:carboxypeptidase-like regulatory domain-containing protein [Bordetella sp. BOR01]|uniref:carboxypeptidase-like regulatory domain-containing protein n=1 Tax=Bordetella sp. BOR01 TaxID=2854779 RepID=UPI001C4487B4|nr:carboxypeptidase-like regulatory domain-containing protein [Bordetella sp. BOR01]MBV7485872.1 carboxypeptidase-like regulatory domain-containing protein [Bordetella sp. BOR01]